MSTEKTYKVSFKIYQNKRLKTVSFHGKEVHPLYIQITFDRQPIYFKSYYFDLLSKPQYATRHFTGNKYPAIKEVEAKEEQLINFIIDKYAYNFSLELFKEKYAYYSRDLLNMMEDDFKNYLVTFFNDEGDNLLASMISMIEKYESGIHIVEGLKHSLKPELYEKMMANAAYHAPPYLPLMEFARKKKEGWLTTFSAYEWERDEAQEKLLKILGIRFQNYDKNQVKNHVKQLLNNKNRW